LNPNLDMEDEIVAAIRRIMRAVDLHSQDLRERCGLTAPQLAAMQEIGRQKQIGVSALARLIHLSQPTVSGIVDRLERLEMVQRTPSKKDRRETYISLSRRGQAVLQDAPSLLRDRFRNELAQLAEWEQTGILTALQRIATMMDAEELDAAPMLTTGVTVDADLSDLPRPAEGRVPPPNSSPARTRGRSRPTAMPTD
jgi:DNA-binding MarR family transcriptional regulator